MNLHLQNSKRLIDLESELMVAGGRDGWGVWDGHADTARFNMDKQQGQLYSAWNSARCHVAA